MTFTASSIQQSFDQSQQTCFTNSHSASEKGKTYRINRLKNEQIIKIKIDNCLITSQQNKCNYAFIIENTKSIIFVELKSEDIGHAYIQIIRTIEYFIKIIKLEKNQIEGCIVSSSVPRHANLKFQSLVARFKKEHGKDLTKHTNQCIRNL